MRILIRADGTVVVTMPHRTRLLVARQFVESKRAWIEEKVKEVQSKRVWVTKSHIERKKEYKARKREAETYIRTRVAELNRHYGFANGTISIRNQSTRWGSCSRKGNLNFNYKVAFLPEYMGDYIIVHELCHLKEFNHSKRFWELVAQTVPHHKKIRAELRAHALKLQ